MWKPDKPILVAGRVLNAEEAWRHEFKDEYYERCNGEVDGEWLSALAARLYPLNSGRAPRQAAVAAFNARGKEDEQLKP